MIDNVRRAEIEFVVRGCAWRGNLLLRSEDSQPKVWNACEILTGAPDTGTHRYHRRGFKIEEGHCQSDADFTSSAFSPHSHLLSLFFFSTVVVLHI